MRLWIIRIGILAVIGVGGYVLRDRLSSSAGELKVGDCFDDPAGVTVVTDVQHHPCSETHTAEVVYLGRLPSGDATFPSDAVVEAWVRDHCLPAWTSYTGKVFDIEQTLGLGFYQPSPEGWSSGDRDMVCYAVREDGAAMSSSVRVAP